MEDDKLVQAGELWQGNSANCIVASVCSLDIILDGQFNGQCLRVLFYDFGSKKYRTTVQHYHVFNRDTRLWPQT